MSTQIPTQSSRDGVQSETMASVHDVAAAIIAESESAIDPSRLQSLLYLTQAWALALNRAPLFMEPIEASKAGPRVDTVYREYQVHGSGPIGAPARGDATALALAEISVVRAVIDSYASLSGAELSALVHNDPPWSEGRDGAEPFDESGHEITQESLSAQYRDKRFGGHAGPREHIDIDPDLVTRALRGDPVAWADFVEQVAGARPEIVD